VLAGSIAAGGLMFFVLGVRENMQDSGVLAYLLGKLVVTIGLTIWAALYLKWIPDLGPPVKV